MDEKGSESFESLDPSDLIDTEEAVKHLDVGSWINILNEMFRKNKVPSVSEKKGNKQFVKTVLKESIPISLRAHYLFIISGGFLTDTKKACRY